MATLIDADELKLELKWLECDRPVYHDVMSTIDDAPTVDAVEVIRCKDCEHSKYWYRDKHLCYLWSETGIGVFEDGYCSYGERRKDEID